jgi:hypothetical protein
MIWKIPNKIVIWYGKPSSIFSISFLISPCLSSIFSISFHYSTWVSSIFSMSFHDSTYFSSIFRRKVSRIVKRYGNYGEKVSWIVKRYGKCRRKVGWIVKWYEKYGRKLWNDNISSVFSKSFHYSTYFLPYFPVISQFNLFFVHIFQYFFTIQPTFLPMRKNRRLNCEMIWKIRKKIVKYGKYGRKASWNVKRYGQY